MAAQSHRVKTKYQLPISCSVTGWHNKKIPMKKSFRLFATFFFVWVTACKQEIPNPEVTQLQKQLKAATMRSHELEEDLKALKGDQIAAAGVAEDMLLLLSRIERLKEKLTQLGALKPAAEGGAPEGGGGGHH
jgi:hypothetical protein